MKRLWLNQAPPSWGFSFVGWLVDLGNTMYKILLLSSFIAFSCVKTGVEMKTVTYEVEGMVIQNGFLWLGWPNNIGKALDELKGVSSHKFDNESWIFTVNFNPKEVKMGKFIETIESEEWQFKIKNWKII